MDRRDVNKITARPISFLVTNTSGGGADSLKLHESLSVHYRRCRGLAEPTPPQGGMAALPGRSLRGVISRHAAVAPFPAGVVEMIQGAGVLPSRSRVKTGPTGGRRPACADLLIHVAVAKEIAPYDQGVERCSCKPLTARPF